MRTLNFNHLHYFWVVARLGSVTQASRELHLTQPTLSTQIKQLERELGAALFTRTGREMVLTPTGRLVLRHADTMFRSCQDMVEVLAGRSNGDGGTLRLGLSKSVEKLAARAMLEPLRSADPAFRLVCIERRTDLLLEELRLRRLDLIVTDRLMSLSGEEPAASCMIGQSPVNLCATPELVARYARGFPASLRAAPFVLPVRGTPLREELRGWFDLHRVRPAIVAEAEDRAMLNYLGQAGFGIIPVAASIGPEIERQFGVRRLGVATGVQDRCFALALEPSLRKPAVGAVFAAARASLSPMDPGANGMQAAPTTPRVTREGTRR